MGNHHYWKNLYVEGILLVGCITFFLTVSNRIVTFEALHNTCYKNDSYSEYQALQELLYKYPNLVTHKDMRSLHP
jgi:hypothetical protein